MAPLEQIVLDRQVIIGANLSAREEAELIDTLAKTKTSSLGQPLTYKGSAEI
jgi:hypothetical protein